MALVPIAKADHGITCKGLWQFHSVNNQWSDFQTYVNLIYFAQMQSAPSTVYSQSTDKQRVVIVGKSKARIAEMIAFVLKQNKRRFDISSSSSEDITDAATIIIEANGD